MSDTPRTEAPLDTDPPQGAVAVEPADADPVDDADAGSGGPEQPSADLDTGPPARGRRLLLVLPWVLMVLAVTVAVVSTFQWQQLRATDAAQADVERVAGTFMLTLTTWDATEGMAATREELREAGTDRFAGEVDELFGTTEDLAGLSDIGARSEGEVRRLYVQEVDGDRATALVVVVQRLVSDVSSEEVNVRYAELELLERGGDWLVDDVELLIDVAETRGGGDGVTPGADAPQDDAAEDDAAEEGDEG